MSIPQQQLNQSPKVIQFPRREEAAVSGDTKAEPARILSFRKQVPESPAVQRTTRILSARHVVAKVSDAGLDAILAIGEAEHIKL